MRKSTRAELRMLRELGWHFGLRTRCRFCKKPLLEIPDGVELQFGARDLPPIRTALAIHHEDEVRENNEDSNRKPAHSECHKRYHARLQAQRKKENRHGSKKEIVVEET